MSDTTPATPAPVSPEQEDVIAFRLAQKALRYMAMWLTPLVAAGGLLGYGGYKDLKNKYDEQTVRLEKETQKTAAQAETLRIVMATLRDTMRVRAAEMAYNNRETTESLNRLRNFQSDLTKETLNLQSDVRSATNGVTSTSRELRRNFESLATDNQTWFNQMVATANTAQQRADSAVRIAEEARVQTVGARQPQELYGTPFVIRFQGVSGNSLRQLRITDKRGGQTKEILVQPSHEPIPLPDATNPTHYIEIINVLDIPAGLLRLVGQSRADAATFRVTRVIEPRSAALTSTH
jgi:hypothetical protein